MNSSGTADARHRSIALAPWHRVIIRPACLHIVSGCYNRATVVILVSVDETGCVQGCQRGIVRGTARNRSNNNPPTTRRLSQCPAVGWRRNEQTRIYREEHQEPRISTEKRDRTTREANRHTISIQCMYNALRAKRHSCLPPWFLVFFVIKFLLPCGTACRASPEPPPRNTTNRHATTGPIIAPPRARRPKHQPSSRLLWPVQSSPMPMPPHSRSTGNVKT